MNLVLLKKCGDCIHYNNGCKWVGPTTEEMEKFPASYIIPVPFWFFEEEIYKGDEVSSSQLSTCQTYKPRPVTKLKT